jgi:hypothetical protein
MKVKKGARRRACVVLDPRPNPEPRLNSGALSFEGDHAMRLYKLTDANHKTMNATQWYAGKTHTAPGRGELCSNGWLHAYLSPELAVLLNPIHADLEDPVLWEAEGSEPFKFDHQLKVGCASITTLRIIPLPVVCIEQRVTFAIHCALAVCSDPSFVKWATAWLNGTDRSETAAWAAAAAAWAAEATAAQAAQAAARAAEAAEAAAWAAEAAAPDFDLIAIAKAALT